MLSRVWDKITNHSHTSTVQLLINAGYNVEEYMRLICWAKAVRFSSSLCNEVIVDIGINGCVRVTNNAPCCFIMCKWHAHVPPLYVDVLVHVFTLVFLQKYQTRNYEIRCMIFYCHLLVNTMSCKSVHRSYQIKHTGMRCVYHATFIISVTYDSTLVIVIWYAKLLYQNGQSTCL